MSADAVPVNEPRPGAYRCDQCLQWVSGSHYHCARCGAETGMYGHYRSEHLYGDSPLPVEGHLCCPGDCGLPTAEQTFDEALARLLEETP